MSGHLIELDGCWPLWRWVMMRATGFPADSLLELADVDLAADADALERRAREVQELRERATEEIAAQFGERHPQRKTAIKLIKRLRRGEVAGDLRELAIGSEAFLALEGLEPEHASQRARYEASYAAAVTRNLVTVRRWAVEPRFREAVAWQNRPLLQAAFDHLREPSGGPSNSKDRQREHLVASYLQRYCAKNDTIGFFGPIAWGELSTTDEVSARPGRALLKKRRVYFETWAIDAVASALTSSDDVKPFVPPRLMPTVAVSGTTLQWGFDRVAKIAPTIARVLVACDGETPAVAIARMLVDDASVEEVTSVNDVYELLQDLADKKLVAWTLNLGALLDPVSELRQRLEIVEPAAVRERLLAALARLEVARQAVEAAAGDVPRLERALDELATVFHEVTGQASNRRGGEVYAARTTVYEDCERDLDVTIGRPVLDRIGPVVSLVGHAARWFSHEIAARYRPALLEVFGELERTSAGPIRCHQFLQAAGDLLAIGTRSHLVRTVEDELGRRWGEILGVDPSQRSVERRAAELEAQVATAFAAPAPGWPGARHLSPDVLLAARSVDDLRRGEFTAVLGELHIGNTLQARFHILHGPDDDGGSLVRASERDLAPGRVLTVIPRQIQNRAILGLWSLEDFAYELGADRSWRAADHVLRTADLVVERAGASLCVRHVCSGRTFDVILFFEAYLTMMAIGSFKPIPPGPHVPRVTIDGVVVSREQWRFERTELPVLGSEQGAGAAAFAIVRAWAQQVGLPRWVFVKIPEEPKPVYIDFASPVYVDMFCKLMRQASAMSISEMLPSIEDSWLPDAEGQTYTCELRMVAVDPAAWIDPLGR